MFQRERRGLVVVDRSFLYPAKIPLQVAGILKYVIPDITILSNFTIDCYRMFERNAISRLQKILLPSQ
jgi:hypothetical protein